MKSFMFMFPVHLKNRNKKNNGFIYDVNVQFEQVLERRLKRRLKGKMSLS